MNLTDKIRQYDKGVINNPYQGMDKKVFIVTGKQIGRAHV